MDRALPIERATLDDAPEILELQRLAYHSEAELLGDWSIEPLRQGLEDIRAEFGRTVPLKACMDGRIIGSVRAALDGGTCRIGKLIVHSAFQRRGIGSALLSTAEGLFPEARRCELFTSHKSLGNLRLYARHGYTEVRRKVLSGTVTLVFLEKYLMAGA